MANPTIHWGTRVITVPQSFLTPLGGANYQLDTNALRIALKDLEDDEAGIAFPPTHRHNTEVTLGGIQYARTVEIINSYTITFASTGTPYKVFLTGSNNNILDVTNLNDVSVASNNSGGLIGLRDIGAAAETSKRLIEGLRQHHSGYGNVFYWDPVNGSDTNDGITPNTACATFAYIHAALVQDWNHDIVMALSGNPSGQTVTTENIEITKNFVFLRGPGRDFLIQSTNDALDSIKITGDGVQVEKMMVGNSPANTKHAVWSSGDFVHINRLIVYNTNKGIEIFGGDHINIESCNVQNNLGYGLKIAGGANHVDVRTSHFGDNGGNGITIDNAGGTDTIIHDENTSHGNTGYGIEIKAGSTDVVIHSGVNVFNNAAGQILDNGVNTYNESAVALAENASAVWAKTLEGMTAEEMMRVMLAALAGKRQGVGTSTEQYMGRDGTTPRITCAGFDASGNGTPSVNGAL